MLLSNKKFISKLAPLEKCSKKLKVFRSEGTNNFFESLKSHVNFLTGFGKAAVFFAAGFSFFILFSFPSDAASPEIPKIISRAQWGADENLMVWQPEYYGKAKKIIVHHSGGFLGPEDPDGTYSSSVRAIYHYHAVSAPLRGESGNGWGDIGYHYLIDPKGNIYQGRAGKAGVKGGHVWGFNEGTIGICILGAYGGWINEGEKGNYQARFIDNPLNVIDEEKGERYNSAKERWEVYLDMRLSSQARRSLEKLVGWLAANNGIDVNQKSQHCGGSYCRNIYGFVGHGKRFEDDPNGVAWTNCPGDNIYNMLGAIRGKASALALEYKNYLYQVPGDTAVYLIRNGQRQYFASLNTYLKEGRTYKKLVNISRNQLERYPLASAAGYPDGTLIRAENSSDVWIIENNKRRKFAVSAEEFVKLNFKWADIQGVSDKDLEVYKEGKPIIYGPDGSLLREPGSKVYFIESGRKRWISSPALFNKLGYKWEDVKELSEAELESILDGRPMLYPDGTLVKGAGPDVFLIEKEKKRKFTSSTLFLALGYNWKDVLTISNEELAFHLDGQPMLYPDKTLIREKNRPTVWLVENGQRREFTAGALFEKLGYRWSDIVDISSEEVKNHPLGKLVLWPDGSLLKEKNKPTVFLIENGQKRKFFSGNLFKKLGYKWSDIVEVNSNELKEYPEAGPMLWPDGTLIKKENGFKVYLIKEGRGEWIKTYEEFKKGGYKWKDVITVPLDEFNLYVAAAGGPTSDSFQRSDDGSQGPAENQNQQQAAKGEGRQPQDDDEKSNEQEPIIRVGIYPVKENEEVVLTANGSYDVYDRDGSIVTKSKGEITTIPYSASAYFEFIPKAENVIMEVSSFNDPNWNNTANYNQFRGSIKIEYSPVSKKLWVINELPLENYLKGIAEACQNDPTEYIKTMILAARTYAYYYLKRGGKYGADEVFHLKNTASDQLYKGYGREILASDITDAVEATSGEVITYNNQPIVAAYSSGAPELMSKGTKSACSVWGGSFCQSGYEYLAGGVRDPQGTSYNYSSCGGACHCVGLSGAGVRQMAENGMGYKEILKHYYPGTEIKKLY